MRAAAEPSSFDSALERLKQVAPLAATAFGFLYGAGFVIVNAYLGSYGVQGLEAVRTRYVGAGVVFLVFVAVVFAGSRVLAYQLGRAGSRRWLALLMLFAGPAALTTLESILIWRLGSGPLGDQSPAPTFGARFVVAAYLCNFTLLGLTLTARLTRAIGARPGALFVRGAFVWIAAFAASGVILAYASYLYPAVPAFLGGGAPARVRLVMSSLMTDACPPCAREEVLLIDQTQNRWVVLVRDAQGRDVAAEIFLLANGDRAILHQR